MIIVTSISPSHLNNGSQLQAIESWRKFGTSYSMNVAREIEQLSTTYNITFIETKKTIQHLVGKPLISINAMIDFSISLNEDLILINSDIIIDTLPELRQDGITILNRFDYTNDFNDGQIWSQGFDFFYIPKKFLSVFPPSIYAMGSLWVDYYIPYFAILNNIPVYSSNKKHIFHKLHTLNYDGEEWKYLGEYFRLDFKFEKHLNTDNIKTRTLNRIKNSIIYI